MKDSRKAEEIAANRVQMMSRLLVEGLDGSTPRFINASTCMEHNGAQCKQRMIDDHAVSRVVQGEL